MTMVFIFDRVLQHLRAEFFSSHLCRSPRTSARSFWRIGPATVRAAERAMGRGKHFKFGPQIKRMRSPWSEQSFVGELDRAVAVYRVQRPMSCLRTEGRILFEPPVQEPPHLRAFIFESWAGQGACC